MNRCSHMIAHSRLGHPNDEYYDIMLIHNMADGLQSLGDFDRHVGTPCHDCPHGHALSTHILRKNISSPEKDQWRQARARAWVSGTN